MRGSSIRREEDTPKLLSPLQEGEKGQTHGVVYVWLCFLATADTTLPHILPFGLPRFQPGIVITPVITAIVLLSNIIASIQAFDSVTRCPSPGAYSQGTLITGIGTSLSGLLGVVGNVPISGSASFVSITRPKLWVQCETPLWAQIRASWRHCWDRAGPVIIMRNGCSISAPHYGNPHKVLFSQE